MLNLLKSKLSERQHIANKGVITFLNPYSYLLLRNRKDLIKECDRVYIDGQWLCYFLKWFKISVVPRCSFDNTSLAPVVISDAQTNHKSVAVIGSDADSNDNFCEYLYSEYPELDIRFNRHGYFNSESEINSAHEEILSKNINLVIVGMGTIRQEEFLVLLKKKGWNGTGYTCGGFIHQTANKGHGYYPLWADSLNLRFIYRIWDEPKLLRRYTIDYFKFVIFYIKDTFTYRFAK